MKEFLPKEYTVPESTNGYMKLKQGENKFRVLDSAIIGWETWTDTADGKRKPLRFRVKENIPADQVGDSLKHFWAFPVWNYQDKQVQVLELTQKGLQKSIQAIVKDEDWGDPKGYDLVITRDGEGLETEYQVNPKPHKELEESIVKFYKGLNINLEALYDGEDPFATKELTEELEDIPFE